MIDLPVAFLRLCSGCSRNFTRPYADPPSESGEPAFCPDCTTGLAVVAEPNGRVRLFGYHQTFEFCVLARDGDVLTVRRLGFPQSESFQIGVGNVRPEFSYDRVRRGPARRR